MRATSGRGDPDRARFRISSGNGPQAIVGPLVRAAPRLMRSPQPGPAGEVSTHAAVFGFTTDLASKTPCVCVGGVIGGRVGTVSVFPAGQHYEYDCLLPVFNAAGDRISTPGCLLNGGSVVFLSK